MKSTPSSIMDEMFTKENNFHEKCSIRNHFVKESPNKHQKWGNIILNTTR